MDNSAMPQSPNTGASIGSHLASQKIMKQWSELNEEEKLETLRREIRNSRHLMRRIISLQEDINRLKSHTHDGFGQVVVPMHTVGATLAGADAAMMHDPLA